jgi:hypothetical protein
MEAATAQWMSSIIFQDKLAWKLQLLNDELYNLSQDKLAWKPQLLNDEQYMISISYNLKASSMFLQEECVGGPRMDPRSRHGSRKIK